MRRRRQRYAVGHLTPTEDRLVRKTMAGIRRTLGTAPRTKTATRTKFLRQLVLDLPHTAEGMREYQKVEIARFRSIAESAGIKPQ